MRQLCKGRRMKEKRLNQLCQCTNATERDKKKNMSTICIPATELDW